MQKNNHLTFFSENSMADVLQQEMAQRLLAIRMNAALYSRRNEGRKTQELADQAVNMADDIIQHFEHLLNIMRLPRMAFEQGVFNAVAALKKSITAMGVLQYTFDIPQELDKLSAGDAFFIFQVLHGIVLQFMLANKKTSHMAIKLMLDTHQQECVMVIHIPDGHEPLVFLKETLHQRIAENVAYDTKQSTLKLTVPVAGLV